MVTESDVNKLVEDVERITKRKEMDLSSDADLSIGIMNLINLEEHLFFTAMETGKDYYLDTLQEVRRMRVELLKKIVKESEGEVWCISKHLLTAAMRLMETGTKRLEEGNIDEAKSMFEKSYRLYSLFWEVNSRVIIGKEKLEEKLEEKAPAEEKTLAQKEAETKEKVVFLPVCKESL